MWNVHCFVCLFACFQYLDKSLQSAIGKDNVACTCIAQLNRVLIQKASDIIAVELLQVLIIDADAIVASLDLRHMDSMTHF